MDRFETDMTDEEWAVIAPLIPPPGRMGRPRELDMREVFNAVQFILGTGCQWRAVPKRFRRHRMICTLDYSKEEQLGYIRDQRSDCAIL